MSATRPATARAVSYSTFPGEDVNTFKVVAYAAASAGSGPRAEFTFRCDSAASAESLAARIRAEQPSHGQLFRNYGGHSMCRPCDF